MTKEDFNYNWTKYFSDTIPISHMFRHNYPDRWFRIHSLPGSKRYPENVKEWTTLLSRQNQIISDLFGENKKVILVTGEYNWGERTDYITDEEEVFKRYRFERLENIDLYKLFPDDYDDCETYRPAFSEIIWESNKHDNLLKEIANDKVRAFFVSFDKNILIAPYDGGVDFVLIDSDTRDLYKQRYKEWLSQREDGC
ncbi:hypothetical protein [Saccharicrinis sp. FJH54]|uniref:DUF3885 domain-containing protein n=1 Tax=Saccharicrinis sp. FJH54 TaxID=3344665 RepID=UPI0035D5258B